MDVKVQHYSNPMSDWYFRASTRANETWNYHSLHTVYNEESGRCDSFDMPFEA